MLVISYEWHAGLSLYIVQLILHNYTGDSFPDIFGNQDILQQNVFFPDSNLLQNQENLSGFPQALPNFPVPHTMLLLHFKR